VRKLLLVSLLVLAPLMAQEPAPAKKAPADHVVLISIDGLRPEFYLDPTWPAPTLQQMVAEGAHARAVRGVYPTVTYPSHTTLITGALPARHGIFYNSPFEPDGVTGAWFWEASAIRARTLWDALKDAGRETAAVSWPVSVGAPITRNVPEVWSLDEAVDALAPVRSATTAGLWEELEREATGRLTSDRLGLEEMARDDVVGDIGAYLLAKHKPALLALHIIEADHFQHEEGREGRMVRRAVGAADRAVGKLVEAAQRAGIAERTAIIVTGDHGFVDIHTVLRPNIWLARAGLCEAAPETGRGRWRAVFHTTGASAFLRTKERDDTAAVHATRVALEALPAGVRRLFRVLDREEIARLGGDPAAALALAPTPGVSFSASLRGQDVDATTGGTHGYVPDFDQIHTGFVAWGPMIQNGVVVPMMGLEDVAPLIARLLGVPFDAPDGVAPLGVIAR
jgi:arylsulfatase A-like enzyme